MTKNGQNSTYHPVNGYTILMTGVLVSGEVCFDCGHVELVADAAKLKSAMKTS